MACSQAIARALLALALVAGVGGRAAADPDRPAPERSERLAIHSLEFSGQIAPPLRDNLAARLREGLTTVGFDVVSGQARGSACVEAPCLREMADKLGARYLVSAQVQESAKTFEIALELITGRTGVVVGTSRERCEICGAEEVGEKMSLAASALRSRLMVLATAPVRFVIRTRPHGASVQIDGRPVGQTPVDVSLTAGPHRMSIEHPGFSPLKRSFTVVSGVDESLDLDLVRLPSPFPFRLAGWSSLAVASVLAAGGVYLMQLDGNEVPCSPDRMDGGGNCPRVYQTKLAAAGVLGLSAVSATLGSVWLFLAPPAQPTDTVGPERASGLTIGARGRF
jgi:hypothetical protein